MERTYAIRLIRHVELGETGGDAHLMRIVPTPLSPALLVLHRHRLGLYSPMEEGAGTGQDAVWS